ncbi:MAG: hypothetical protein LBE81_04945 [Azonexus sp.]|jgi:hypothetical protein|uniref:hypothetical protein n=1 Tax=Azonexus sp. TaxID=1872668 RepID=UPI00281BCC2C|nr:hypothetical protein [Azonexus sp.]MDR0775968.1 hypothetical protein [Azonexus sp.]
MTYHANLSTHHVEQAGRGLVMFELAKRGYTVQFTGSRFPTADLLVVSSSDKHFGIDIKAQKTKNFWRMKCPLDSEQLFYCFTYIGSISSLPEIYIMPSKLVSTLWHEYKNAAVARSVNDDNIWGLKWTTPRPYKDNWACLPG